MKTVQIQPVPTFIKSSRREGIHSATKVIRSGILKNHHNKTTCKRNFPETLFDFIETPASEDILKWVAGGSAFIIIDRSRFTDETLPAYFNGTKYKSFIRKLNRWNFRRITRGPYVGAYHHPFFKRANRSLCKLMTCWPTKASCGNDNGPQLAAPSGQEPNNSLLHLLKTASLRDSCPTSASSSNSSIQDILKKSAMLERDMALANTKMLFIKQQLKEAEDRLIPLLSMNSSRHTYSSIDTRKRIIKLSSEPKDNFASMNQNCHLVANQTLTEAHRHRIRIEEKKRQLMMKAEELKLLNDIKYLTAKMQQTKQRMDLNNLELCRYVR